MEQELVKRARRGDPAAFARLYEQIYQELYRFALYMMMHRQDAEDAVSDAVIAAYENISSLQDEEAFRGWMFKILTNICRRKLRMKKNAEQELKEDVPGKGADLEASADIREAFLKLSEEERTIVSLTIFGGYKSQELEKMLGIKAATIRSKRSRALAKMAEVLEGRKRRESYGSEGKGPDQKDRGRDEEYRSTGEPETRSSGEKTGGPPGGDGEGEET